MISTHLGFGFEPSKSFKFLYADVAELADALASGASDRKVMWVQVPSPAPRQVVEIRLVFLLLIHFKTAVAELHQIFDLVEAELVPQHEIFDLVEAELVPQLDKR